MWIFGLRMLSAESVIRNFWTEDLAGCRIVLGSGIKLSGNGIWSSRLYRKDHTTILNEDDAALDGVLRLLLVLLALIVVEVAVMVMMAMLVALMVVVQMMAMIVQ
uniref:Uncharacterized protein n=1 Tax=Anopheles atroparvus TaxID=41427 RepID=A0A182JD69_ANOAO